MVQQISSGAICHASNASAKVHVKHTPMDKAGEPNVKQANVKQACESKQAIVKQVCESKPQVRSDPTAKVISSQGISMDVDRSKNVKNDQPITAAKVVSPWV